MELLESTNAGVTVVHIVGRVNSANAPDVEARLQAALDRGCRGIVVDLSRLDHMTSAGFRSLLQAEKRADGLGAQIVLCGLQGLTLELFEIGGFLEMFAVAPSREEGRPARGVLDGAGVTRR